MKSAKLIIIDGNARVEAPLEKGILEKAKLAARRANVSLSELLVDGIMCAISSESGSEVAETTGWTSMELAPGASRVIGESSQGFSVSLKFTDGAARELRRMHKRHRFSGSLGQFALKIILLSLWYSDHTSKVINGWCHWRDAEDAAGAGDLNALSKLLNGRPLRRRQARN